MRTPKNGRDIKKFLGIASGYRHDNVQTRESYAIGINMFNNYRFGRERKLASTCVINVLIVVVVIVDDTVFIVLIVVTTVFFLLLSQILLGVFIVCVTSGVETYGFYFIVALKLFLLLFYLLLLISILCFSISFYFILYHYYCQRGNQVNI